MMEYTICVDGRYFVGETMMPMQGYSIAPSGFFQMVGDNQMTQYEFTEDVDKAQKMIMFNALGYLSGIHERTRYLPDVEKPRMIVLAQVGEGERHGEE